LFEITWPVFEMIRNWVTLGDLQDPFNEFFITEVDASDDKLCKLEKIFAFFTYFFLFL
jgi:hypothetical protein